MRKFRTRFYALLITIFLWLFSFLCAAPTSYFSRITFRIRSSETCVSGTSQYSFFALWCGQVGSISDFLILELVGKKWREISMTRYASKFKILLILFYEELRLDSHAPIEESFDFQDIPECTERLCSPDFGNSRFWDFYYYLVRMGVSFLIPLVIMIFCNVGKQKFLSKLYYWYFMKGWFARLWWSWGRKVCEQEQERLSSGHEREE